MGSTLSCGCDTTRHCFDAACTRQSLQRPQFRFWAELFRLSPDRTSWTILHPSLLSIAVVPLGDSNYPIQLTAKSEAGIVCSQILNSSIQVTRASACFAYWQCDEGIFGLNVVSTEDCERFRRLLGGQAACNDDQLSLSQLTSSTHSTSSQMSSSQTSNSETRVLTLVVHVSRVFELEHGIVSQHHGAPVPCAIELHADNGALLRIGQTHHSLNLLESIMVIGEQQKRLYLSEPSGTFLIECENVQTLRYLMVRLLTTSGYLLTGTTCATAAALQLHRHITKLEQRILALIRSLGKMSAECELTINLENELEMTHLRLFAIKYRLAAICDLPFPTPSEILSKISLRTLRHLKSFGGAAVCLLHLHFLCKSQFRIIRNSTHGRCEELQLNVPKLIEEHSKINHASSKAVKVLLPSGSSIQITQCSDQVIDLLDEVCERLKVKKEQYSLMEDGSDRFRLVENDYRIEKCDRNLGLTICAKPTSEGIQAQICAVHGNGTGSGRAAVGDLVISVDERKLSHLRSIGEAQRLIRGGTSLVLRPRQAAATAVVSTSTSKTVKQPARPLSIPNNPFFQNVVARKSIGKTVRSHSMDRISELSSFISITTKDDTHTGSVCSSPSRIIRRASGHHRHHPHNNTANHCLARASNLDERLCRRDERRLSSVRCVPVVSPNFSTNAQQQLLKTINELVRTEQNFVRDIRMLVSRYLKPINSSILDSADRLLQVQSSFLFSLLDAAGDVAHTSTASQEQLRDALIRLSALFINKCSKFKIYSDYSAAYLRFQQNKKERAEIEPHLEKFNVSGEQSENAQSLLIKPIQRVLKYPLFLQQIRENCAIGTVERQQSDQALSRMQALAEYVNEMQRLNEQYGALIQLIASKNGMITRMSFSQLLMFAHLTWLNSAEHRSRPIHCVAFVFTSLILIVCPTLSRSKNKFYRILPVLNVDVTETDCANVNAGPSTGNSNNSVSSSIGNQYQFTLVYSKQTNQESTVYRLSCPQVEIKNHFIKSIRKASATFAKSQRRPISGSSQSDGGYSSERHVQ